MPAGERRFDRLRSRVDLTTSVGRTYCGARMFLTRQESSEMDLKFEKEKKD